MNNPNAPHGASDASPHHATPSANESAFGATATGAGGDTPASGHGTGELMNLAVRMVIPLRREFGRSLDVSHFLHDAGYARQILDLAKSSQDPRLRGYAAALESRTSPTPVPTTTTSIIEVLAESTASRPTQAGEIPHAPAVSTLALLEAKRFASRRLLHVLGPTATQLCLRIELAATIADVIVAVRRSCTVVRDVRGTTQAALFGDAVEAKLRALSLLEEQAPDRRRAGYRP